jgi:hypothetical protein
MADIPIFPDGSELPDLGSISADSFNLSLDDVLGSVQLQFTEPDFSPEAHAIYEAEKSTPIDYRLRQLSYSSVLTLHECPRKYELYKLGASQRALSKDETITFSFGDAVGDAIQQYFMGWSYEKILLHMFLSWPDPIWDSHSKYRKSLPEGIIAFQKFQALVATGMFEGWEILTYEGRPAAELSFCIDLPDGFRYRGHVDLVLRKPSTGEIRVLELKTTGAATLNPTTYKNSFQAIGYSIVLDAMAPDISSYEVLYLVYQTDIRTYTPLPFEKTYLQRAEWIRQLLLDKDLVSLYHSNELFPKHGESCVQYGRDCTYLPICNLSTDSVTKEFSPRNVDTTDYQITVSIMDLIDTQLAKIPEEFKQ